MGGGTAVSLSSEDGDVALEGGARAALGGKVRVLEAEVVEGDGEGDWA